MKKVDEEANEYKGFISIEHTIWCGRCVHWETISGKKKALIKLWRRAGWKLTKQYGWVCPAHYQKSGR